MSDEPPFLGIKTPYVLAYTGCVFFFGLGLFAAFDGAKHPVPAALVAGLMSVITWVMFTGVAAALSAVAREVAPHVPASAASWGEEDGPVADAPPRESSEARALRHTRGARLESQTGLTQLGEQLFVGSLEGGRRAEVKVRDLSNESARVEVRVDTRGAPELKIAEESASTAIGKKLGLVREVEVGDPAFDGRFLIQSPSDAAAQDALATARIREDVHALFDDTGVTRLAVSPTAVVAELPLGRLDGRAVLAQLASLAARLERRPVEVPSLPGTKALALVAKSATALGRCSYCHEDVSGKEPDLVACDRCSTILHAECFESNGKCPVLGCGGDRAERGRVGSAS